MGKENAICYKQTEVRGDWVQQQQQQWRAIFDVLQSGIRRSAALGFRGSTAGT